MKPTDLLARFALAGALALGAGSTVRAAESVAPDAHAPAAAALATPAALAGAPALEAAAAPSAEPRRLLGEPRFDAALGRYVAPLGDRKAILTLDPRLQARLERSLEGWNVPWGVTVLMEPATGRVLAMAEHSSAEPGRKDLALTPISPAASVFKIVTAAALLERGIAPGQETCFHGGSHRLQPRLLSDDPRRDRRCLTLTSAMGHSANVVFAKLAGRDLDRALLAATAERFLFNVELPFSRRVTPSPARFPEAGFDLAATAAGFGDVRLSPLHGAVLASIVANGGMFVPPTLVEEVIGEGRPAPVAPHRVVDEGVAGALAEMLRSTVTEGTARRTFRRLTGPARGLAVAGKTGSLFEQKPFRDHSWFVGYAPADKPEVVVATVIVNGRLWRTRAQAVAREALEAYFANRVALGPDGLEDALRLAWADVAR